MHTEDLEGRSPISIFRSKKGPHSQRTKPRFSPQPHDAHILHFGLLEVLKLGRCSFPTRLDIISTRYQNSSRNKYWAVENSNIFIRRKRKIEKGGHLPENKIIFFTNNYFFKCPSSIFFWHVLCVIVPFFLSFMFKKKNQNAPKPSEHPPVRGKKCQNV